MAEHEQRKGLNDVDSGSHVFQKLIIALHISARSSASPLATHIDSDNVEAGLLKKIADMYVAAGVLAQAWNHENRSSCRSLCFPFPGEKLGAIAAPKIPPI